MKTSGADIGKIRIFSKVLYRLGETDGYYCVIPRERSDRGNPYLSILHKGERIATPPKAARNDAGEFIASSIPRFGTNLGEFCEYYRVIPRERSDRGNPYLSILHKGERSATTPTESRNDRWVLSLQGVLL